MIMIKKKKKRKKVTTEKASDVVCSSDINYKCDEKNV